jgi:Zn-dependent protease with chaperone function
LAAIALSVGFYALAVGIAGTLIALPFVEYSFFNRMEIRLVIFGVGTGALILQSILPRREKFVVPGPELQPAEHPELADLVRDVARLCGQQPPARIFLVPQVNAWVTRRGGIVGFGARRMMGLGLPLLQVVDVGQLRAILAHEFGHYWNGDTHLGPWIYRTRQSIWRTVETLQRKGSWLQKLFVWYGEHYLRLTMDISRRQELAADQLAARLAGAQTFAAALLRIENAAAAYSVFLAGEYAPALERGVFPPLAEGFDLFWRASSPFEALPEGVPEGAETDGADPYETHPPLRQRLLAIGVPKPDDTSGAPALELLRDPLRFSDSMVPFLAAPNFSTPYRPIAWSEYGSHVLVPIWKKRVDAAREIFGGQPALRLAALARDPEVRGRLARLVLSELGFAPYAEIPEELAAPMAGRALAAAFGIVLFESGFSISSVPGSPVQASRNETRIRPYETVELLMSGAWGSDTWTIYCEALGIANSLLSAPRELPLEGPTLPPPATRRRRHRWRL